jgi:hypothetical protein
LLPIDGCNLEGASPVGCSHSRWLYCHLLQYHTTLPLGYLVGAHQKVLLLLLLRLLLLWLLLLDQHHALVAATRLGHQKHLLLQLLLRLVLVLLVVDRHCDELHTSWGPPCTPHHLLLLRLLWEPRWCCSSTAWLRLDIHQARLTRLTGLLDQQYTLLTLLYCL